MHRFTLFFLFCLSIFNNSCTHNEKSITNRPKNVILFIGDGMGLAEVYASMSRCAQPLNIQKFPIIGLVKTYSSDNYITDSGAGATAYSAGVKTKNGSLGVDSTGKSVELITEQVKTNGMATGIVVTCSITHATPAGFVAHVASRDSDELIARYYLNNTIDVVIGGGRNFFNERHDGINLLDSLKKLGYSIAVNIDSLKNVDSRFFCLYAGKHPDPVSQGRGDVLARSVKIAIEILSKNKNGFFLMVEGSQIDWGGHANNIDYVTDEMIDMDNAIGAAFTYAEKAGNTLVVVTADHETGGLSIIGGNMKTRQIQTSFATKGHSAIMVPLFAYGPGAFQFSGIYENTEVNHKIKKALNLN